jgi:hypothetical protein
MLVGCTCATQHSASDRADESKDQVDVGVNSTTFKI